jgi:hypothetical protein
MIKTTLDAGLWLAAVLVLAGVTACGSQVDSCASEKQAPGCAAELADDQPLPTWAERATPAHGVAVYFDRSASMCGFLDPTFAATNPKDYHGVLDRLIVGLSPARAFAFGAKLQSIPARMATIADQAFCTDRDTRTEDALAEVTRDTALTYDHVLVTDGRRGSARAARGQYVAMRELAASWIARGGTVAVGATLAPFHPVPGDPSGCRRAGEQDRDAATCPLYAFSFVAPGDETAITGTLADVFEHVFVWPVRSAAPLALVVPQAANASIDVRTSWTSRAGQPIARARGRELTAIPTLGRIEVANGSTWAGKAAQAVVRGERMSAEVSVRPLTKAAPGWQPTGASAALVQVAPPDTLRLTSYGPPSPGTPSAYIYRVELIPTGEPTWLSQFRATDTYDSTRTVGLELLFEQFKDQAQRSKPAPVGRLYVVAN